MNANKLADELENVGMEQKHYDTMQQAATMLRQQQAEIEALKKEKWLTEIDYKQQVLKQLIDWLILEQDTLAWRKEKDERK